MKYYRSLALAAVFAGGLALPALAQTASPDAAPAPQAGTSAPQADTSAAMPDAGVKKAPPVTTKHVHRVSHHRAAKTATPGTKK